MKIYKIRVECGTIIDSALTNSELRNQMIDCPTICKTCKHKHGYEHFGILKVEVN